MAWSVPLGVVKLFDKVSAISGSAHTGRALKAAKILNLVGTVRGAVTTVLLASSAVGGAVTVNNVRQDIVANQPNQSSRPAAVARNSPAPTPTPLTAAGLRSDAERRLRTALDQNASGADDLRKVSVLTVESTDALVAQTREKLQARFELALSQVDALLAIPSSSPGASGASASPRPSQSLSVVTVNSLVQVALGDMNGILFVATRTATTTPPVQTVRQTNPPTVAPTVVHTPAPTLVPTLPPRTASPTVRPTPTR